MAKRKEQIDEKPYRMNYNLPQFSVEVELYENGNTRKTKMIFTGEKKNGKCAFSGVINGIEVSVSFGAQEYYEFEIPSFLKSISKDNIIDAVNDYLDHKDGCAC